MSGQRKIICITPIRNEEWILERFLRCASVWADAVVILDQCSTDRSEEIARSFDNVKYVRNENSTFSEIDRQRRLMASAREFGPGNVMIALDADEMLSANFLASTELREVRGLRRESTSAMVL
jgi:glycosyltransferase involved in cell wall biosynthesis